MPPTACHCIWLSQSTDQPSPTVSARSVHSLSHVASIRSKQTGCAWNLMQREGQDTVNVLLARSQKTNIPLGFDSVRAATRQSTTFLRLSVVTNILWTTFHIYQLMIWLINSITEKHWKKWWNIRTDNEVTSTEDALARLNLLTYLLSYLLIYLLHTAQSFLRS